MADQNNTAASGDYAEYVELCNSMGYDAMPRDKYDASLKSCAAASATVPAVDALTRYSDSGNFIDGMIAEPRGEYVKFADVQAILATPSTAPDEQAKQDDPAHVLPPVAAPVSQHGSNGRAFDTLYGAVMNIPCQPDEGWGLIAVNHYKFGHRDARHEAADLVAEFASGFREGRNTTPDSSNLAAPEATIEQMGGAQVAMPKVSSVVRFSDTKQRGVLVICEGRVSDAELSAVRAALAAPTTERAAAPACVGWCGIADCFCLRQRAAEGEATERKPHFWQDKAGTMHVPSGGKVIGHQDGIHFITESAAIERKSLTAGQDQEKTEQWKAVADQLNQLDKMLAEARITDKHSSRQLLYRILHDVCGMPAAPSERKPLMDDQIDEEVLKSGVMKRPWPTQEQIHSFARAIEQHHGITGGGK